MMLSFLRRQVRLAGALVALALLFQARTADAAIAPRNTTLPAPIAFAPDQNWDGIDGSWSSFTLRVGTPAQYVRTFVSFASYQTWVVLPEGCAAAASVSSCAEDRGRIFDPNASSSFDQIGYYDLWIERNLGSDGSALYGYDTVGLGGLGENGPTLRNTTVGGLAITDFYLGVFGINPKPTNFSSFNDPSPSYMSLLKEHDYIPSVSAGYTAGAPYRFTGELASLTLGGYDESKFVANDVSFVFAADNERDLVVGLQSITTPSATPASPVATQLLPNAVYAFIDTTVAQIWLPVEACRAFEVIFGLVYDADSDLYLVNETLHQQLTDRNPNVTFTLAQGLSGGPTVDITLPYAAFDLTAQPPYQSLSNQSYYFPLRRAANATQYTIGRTFFQEAYLTVNWEAQRFNVSQRAWSPDAPSHIIAIPPYTGEDAGAAASPLPGSASGSSISSGAIAGIAIGAVAVVAAAAGLAWWLWRRRRRAAAAAAFEHEKLRDDDAEAKADPARGREVTVFPKAELEGSGPAPPDLPPDSARRRLLGLSDSTGPGTPGTASGVSSAGYFGRGGSDVNSPSTPTAGEGTHSSSQSGSAARSSRGVSAALSPSSASEADSRERQIFEMVGDMPSVREKDGKALSEKEALRHREKVYNGVDEAAEAAAAAAATAAAPDGPEAAAAGDDAAAARPPPRRVLPEDVVIQGHVPLDAVGIAGSEPRDFSRHRAFSFEELRGGAEARSDE